MPPKKTDKTSGFVSVADAPPAPPHVFADNDGFLPESSKNRALAALLLCASEEYSSSLAQQEEHKETDPKLLNCNSTLSTISAASFSMADGINCCKSRDPVRFVSEVLAKPINPSYPIDEQKNKFLSFHSVIKQTSNSRILSSLGDQRAFCDCLVRNEVLSGAGGVHSVSASYSSAIDMPYTILAFMTANNDVAGILALVNRCLPWHNCRDAKVGSYEAAKNAFTQGQSLNVMRLFGTALPSKHTSTATARALYFAATRMSSAADVYRLVENSPSEYFKTKKFAQTSFNNNLNAAVTGLLPPSEIVKAGVEYSEKHDPQHHHDAMKGIRDLLKNDFEHSVGSERLHSMSPEQVDQYLPLGRRAKPRHEVRLKFARTFKALVWKMSDKLTDSIRQNCFNESARLVENESSPMLIESENELLDLEKQELALEYNTCYGLGTARDALELMRTVAILRSATTTTTSSSPIDTLQDFEKHFCENLMLEFVNKCHKDAVFDVFEGEERDGIPRLQRQLPAEHESEHLKLFEAEQTLKPGQPAFVSEAEFVQRWSEFTKGTLDGYSSRYGFAIGGSVVSCLNPAFSSSTSTTGFRNEDKYQVVRDIDIVFCGLDVAGINIEMMKLDKFICDNYPEHVCASTTRTRSYVLPYPLPRIQIILGSWTSIADCLHYSDVDCCGVALSLDGNHASKNDNNDDDDDEAARCYYGITHPKVFANPRAMHAFIFRVNVPTVHAHWLRGSIQYETRLVKYARREGFAVVHSNIESDGEEVKKLSNNNFTKQLKMHKTSGLAWLWMVSNGVWNPTVAPPTAIEMTPEKTLKDVRNEINEEGHVTSDGYGTHESGFYLVEGDWKLEDLKNPTSDGTEKKILSDEVLYEDDLEEHCRLPRHSNFLVDQERYEMSERVATLAFMPRVHEGDNSVEDVEDWCVDLE